MYIVFLLLFLLLGSTAKASLDDMIEGAFAYVGYPGWRKEHRF